ncbi:hypothetical protein ABPG77_005610 [Micractinium sp. CCAP 211/92]
MQRSNVAAGSESGPAPGSSGANALGEPRLSGGLSFREVGDWFKNLGDDLGSMVGIPRSRFSSRRSPGSAPHRFDTVSGGSVSSGSALGTVPRLPSTSLLAKKQQIVVGILMKYVNLGSGWRHRLFVLQDGVLRYYKVYGPTAVSVHELLEALRQQGEIYSIGVEVSLLESRDERMAASGGSLSSLSSPRSPRGRAKLPTPAAEIHLQVATLRESNADYRKFYVHSGTSTLTLRAESKEDRWVWMQALQTSKGSWEGVTPAEASALKRDTTERIVTQDEAFMSFLQEVKGKLQSKGVGPEGQAYVEDLLVQEHQRYHELLVAEENKRKALLDIVYALENDKRQLETAIVVEGTQAAAIKRTTSASDSEEQLLAEDDRQESGVGGGPDEEDQMSSEAEDEFYECESASLSGAHSRVQSVDLTNFVAIDKGGSGANLLAAAGAAGGGSAPIPMRRSGSRTSLPAPDSATSSPTRTPLASSSRGGVQPPAVVAALAAAAAGGGQPDWLVKEGPPPRRRDRLPKPQQAEKSVSLWSLIKDMVGKDLTRVCLPVYFNEPLSALQKTAEDLEYSELLDQAAELPPGSVERLLRVAAFAVSPYSSTPGRTAKPFNPLLGETFEFVCPENGFRFLAEKVVHHPTVIAAVAEGRRWRYEGDADVKSKFWGRSIELRPEGLMQLSFDDGDVYQWNKVTTSINNLILGKIYIDHGGIMKVRCVNTGMAAKLRFKEAGLIFDKDPRQVRGFLEQGPNRFERPLIHGHWDSELFADMPDGSTVLLWRKNPPPPEPTRYNLTAFSIKLNELTPGLEAKVAPTDCRLRPDQHCLELGQYDQANQEKQRLEHKQRAARKAAERGDPIRPRWFDFVNSKQTSFTAGPGGGGAGKKPGEALVFRYKGGYWEEREAGQFTGCRDIFGPAVVPD